MGRSMNRVTLTLPRLGETMEEARVTAWLVAPGAAFRRGDVLLEVETDKTVVEVPALTDGTLIARLVAEGETVALDQPIAEADVPEPAPPPPSHGGEGRHPGSAGTAADGAGGRREDRHLPSPPWGGDGGGGRPGRRLAASPAARAAGRRAGVDLSLLEGTGRRGRVTREDVAKANLLRADVAGAGAATVVLLHGLFDDHRTWRDLTRRLTQAGQRVLAPDLPGHGGGAFAGIAATVEGLRAALPPGPLLLVGHSLGAVLAARLAGTLGPRVRHLVLLAPAGLGSRISGDFVEGMLHAATPEALARALAPLGTAPLSSPALAAELDRLQAMRPGHRAVAEALVQGGFQQADIRADLARADLALSVVFGTGDRILDWRDVAELPPHAAIHLIRDAGHLPHLADPALVAGLVLDGLHARERSVPA